MDYRVLITGSRSWSDINCIRSALSSLDETYENITLVSGACPKGADMLCEKVAAELGWNIERYPADWSSYGNRAGFVRNTVMVDTEPDIVIGFIRNNSKGASMTINLAKKKKLWTITHSLVDYPYESYNKKEFNSPDSPVSLDKDDEEMLF